MAATGDVTVRSRSRHFLWEYCCHFPDRRRRHSASITTRLPYYMAMNLLRVARNDYIAAEYRRHAWWPRPSASCRHADPMTRRLDGWPPCSSTSTAPSYTSEPTSTSRTSSGPSGTSSRYQGVDLRRDQVREMYFDRLKHQKCESQEAAPGVRRGRRSGGRSSMTSPTTTPARCPQNGWRSCRLTLAEIYRGVSRKKLKLYPHVRHVLEPASRAVSAGDRQRRPKRLRPRRTPQGRILDYFDPIIVSGDHGFRKPDSRLFEYALDGLKVTPRRASTSATTCSATSTARQIGMRTVMFDSDQGTKQHEDCVPDHRITDMRDLLGILGL